MRLVKVDAVPPSVARKNDDRGKNKRLLRSFMDSGDFINEVILEGGERVETVYPSLISTVRYSRFPVTVIRRGDRVFLKRGESRVRHWL